MENKKPFRIFLTEAEIIATGRHAVSAQLSFHEMLEVFIREGVQHHREIPHDSIGDDRSEEVAA